METIYDVRQLLKKFGIFIYLGERLADLSLMELELEELYRTECISIKDYQSAILIIRQEKRRIQSNQG